MLDETRIRLDAVNFVRALRERWVAVPASELRQFRVHLKGQQGIFKPAQLTEPLSITTTIDSERAQDTIEGSRVLYDFVSRDSDNEALKRAAEAELPLIYFLQVKKRPATEYVIFAPVYVVGWSDESRCFAVDLSEQKPGEIITPAPAERQLQLHVMRTPQSPGEIREDPKPAIEVSDGIAMCATHHRAFDAEILRFDDEYRIHIEVEDAALLPFDGQLLSLPSQEHFWPRLGERASRPQ